MKNCQFGDFLQNLVISSEIWQKSTNLAIFGKIWQKSVNLAISGRFLVKKHQIWLFTVKNYQINLKSQKNHDQTKKDPKTNKEEGEVLLRENFFTLFFKNLEAGIKPYASLIK